MSETAQRLIRERAESDTFEDVLRALIAAFDNPEFPGVSVMPPDGFGSDGEMPMPANVALSSDLVVALERARAILARERPPIDTTNDRIVGINGGFVTILAPKQRLLPIDALRLAAWLVINAKCASAATLIPFERVLDAIKNSGHE